MANTTSFTPQEIEQFLQQFFDVVGARQYIGARYVPIFGRAGSDTVEWDDLAPYEPLTVVMHDGISYVSRRYVPAGIEISDTAYWVETYRFNAQVEQYRQEVLGFQDEIDGIRETMEADYVPFPDYQQYPKYGTLGQVLSTLADGSTMWQDPVIPSDEQAEEIITQWLNDHPEATTTVQDNTVSDAKLVQTGGVLSKAIQAINALCYNLSTAQNCFPYATLGDAYTNRIYYIFNTSAVENYITDLPDMVDHESICYLISSAQTNDLAVNTRIKDVPSGYAPWQILISTNSHFIATRTMTNQGWSQWTYIGGKYADASIRASHVVLYNQATVTSRLPNGSLADLPTQSVAYCGTGAIPYISDAPFTNENCNIMTFDYLSAYGESTTADANRYVMQVAFTATGRYLTRVYTGTWSAWAFNLPEGFLNDLERRSLMTSGSITYNAATAQNNFPNGTLGDAYVNKWYYINPTSTVQSVINDLPFGIGGFFYLITLSINAPYNSRANDVENQGPLQLAVRNDGNIMSRILVSGEGWTSWAGPLSPRPIQITPSSFHDQLFTANNAGYQTIGMAAGTYNLFDSTHDETWWLNHITGTRGLGFPLGNHTTIIGRNDAKFVFNYTGSNQTILNEFSIFCVNGDYELIGVNMDIGDGEYCIHDDIAVMGTTAPSTGRVSKCNMKTNRLCAIGGGCGQNTVRTIEDCVFNVPASLTYGAISWHPNGGGNGHISIHNSHFSGGSSVRAHNYNQNNGLLTMIVSGNSMTAAPINGDITGITYLVFNNEIRQS